MKTLLNLLMVYALLNSVAYADTQFNKVGEARMEYLSSVATKIIENF